MKPLCMRMIGVGVLLVGVFATGHFASAEMSSANFLIKWDTISQGGADDHSSASYLLRDTVGNAGAGNSSSATYDLRAGYRQGVFDQVITFNVEAQDSSTGRDATALAGETVTTDTSGLSVGDLIAVIEDESASAVAAIGRIASIGAGTVTVDAFKDAGVAPVIDGTDDTVYVLDSSSLNLGELDAAAISFGFVAFEVSADLDGGYVVQVFDDGDLRDGAETIDDVADGAVTAGSEEYGGRSSDTSLAGSTFDTEDTGFDEDFEEVADEVDVQFESRNFVTLKASIAPGTPDGDYDHALSFIVSGNF